VGAANLRDFEAFFESPGAPKHCWCMVWRRTSEEARQHDTASRKRQMMKRIGAGAPVGLLAYEENQAVGWVSIAPRDTYRNLGGPLAEPGEVIWSLVCFFIRRLHRGRGLTAHLIEAAVDYARKEGATVVEAYPVDASAPSYRFMGFVEVFEAAGFADHGMAGRRRHVMRRRV
jgi:GNAT superfamily N-acetyltransferase